MLYQDKFGKKSRVMAGWFGIDDIVMLMIKVFGTHEQ